MALTSCNHLFYHPDSYERLTPTQIGLDYTEISIETDDHLKLSAWFIPAKGIPRGTLLHFHGNAENMTGHFLFFAWIVEQGFNLVAFDYRGYGKSEGHPSREGLVLDGTAAIKWLQRQTFPGADHIYIAAQSLGGAVAIPALRRAGSEHVKAVLLDSTFSSYRHITRSKLGSFWLTWPLQWPLSFLVSDDLSPIDDIKYVQGPYLFVHSPNDPVVPYDLGRRLYEAAPEPKEFWDIPGGGHTSAFVTEDSPYRAKLVDYFSKMK